MEKIIQAKCQHCERVRYATRKKNDRLTHQQAADIIEAVDAGLMIETIDAADGSPVGNFGRCDCWRDEG